MQARTVNAEPEMLSCSDRRPGSRDLPDDYDENNHYADYREFGQQAYSTAKDIGSRAGCED